MHQLTNDTCNDEPRHWKRKGVGRAVMWIKDDGLVLRRRGTCSAGKDVSVLDHGPPAQTLIHSTGYKTANKSADLTIAWPQ